MHFVIHAQYGSGRIYTATTPRQVARKKTSNNQPWGKTYLLNWPYVRFHKTFDVLFPDNSGDIWKA